MQGDRWAHQGLRLHTRMEQSPNGCASLEQQAQVLTIIRRRMRWSTALCELWSSGACTAQSADGGG